MQLQFTSLAHSSYISVLKIDVNHNNPVLNVFIHLLLKEKYDRSESKSFSGKHTTACSSILTTLLYLYLVMTSFFNKIRNRDNDESNVPLLNSGSTDDHYIISKAKKRWYLAYTLIHNPQLIELRRRDYNYEAGYIDDVNIAI